MIGKVRARVKPSWMSKIPEIRKVLPEELRTCPKHGEVIIIREDDFQTALSDGPPFEAELIGCCDEAVNNVNEFAEKTFSDK